MTRRSATWLLSLLLAVAAGVCLEQSACGQASASVTRSDRDAGSTAEQDAQPELKDPAGVVSFHRPWAFHPGDDAAWAEPGYDDSGWARVSSERTLAAQGFGGFHGFGWYRIHVKLPAGGMSLAVALPEILSSYEGYADGQKIGGVGRMPPRPKLFAGQPRMYLLPDAASEVGEVTLAIRFWAAPGEPRPGLGPGSVILGAADRVRVIWNYTRDRQQIFPTVEFWLTTLFDGLVTFGMLGLWLAQRDRREYLMLILANGFAVVASGLTLAVMLGRLPLPWDEFAASAAAYLAMGFALEFIYSFVQTRPGRWARLFDGFLAALVVVALGFFFSAVLGAELWAPLLHAGLFTTLNGMVPLVLVAFTLAVLLPHWRAGHQEAKVILPFAVLYFLGAGSAPLAQAAWRLGLLHTAAGAGAPPQILPKLHLGEVAISNAAILDILLDLAFFAIVLVRHTRVSRERERTQAELAAARTVQQVMLPEPVGIIPGITVEVEYLPMAEVGGDFYQMMKTADGGLLLVTGDVSGKGVPAAMLVALLVGAIRTEAAHTSDPAMLLKVLNARVHGRMNNGFATCAVLSLRADGLAMLANAANPAPYLNGQEVELEGALPLGLTPEVDYPTRAFWLECGDRLTFVSDGVVEAERGRELFGFERTQRISMEGAREIAEAARSFGQADDITVLTVRRV